MANIWYFQADGKKNGPYSDKELKKLADKMVVTPTTLVWKNDMEKWKPASKVIDLFNSDVFDSLPDIPIDDNDNSSLNKKAPEIPVAIAAIPEWYYLINGKRNGPVVIGVIEEVINKNTNLVSILVWKVGMKEWMPFRNIFPDSPPQPIETPIQSPNSFHSNQLGGVPLGLGDFLTTVSPQNIGWFSKITHPTPLWVAYIVNCLAWLIFVSNRNHILEACMGLACVYVGFVAISKKEEKYAVWLINVSFADALWMFYWAFSKPFDFSID